ncbi:MAG: hypothetical protein IKW07_02135 [Clostridia bacterium]|nr:hypothetical protein [Clostridia bacterium]
MSADEIYTIVKKYIDQMDHWNLLASGAPKDEFDMESKEISRRLRLEMSDQEIADVIVEIFSLSFNEQYDTTDFLFAAGQIKKDLASFV